jgi:hypothetical protein
MQDAPNRGLLLKNMDGRQAIEVFVIDESWKALVDKMGSIMQKVFKEQLNGSLKGVTLLQSTHTGITNLMRADLKLLKQNTREELKYWLELCKNKSNVTGG